MNAPKRNDPCPCGSGKKYKKCCLRLTETQSAKNRQQAGSDTRHGLRHQNTDPRASTEARYRQLLTKDPDNPLALHGLGVLARQGGRYDQAVDLLTRAISIDGTRAEFHLDLGGAFYGLRDFDQAITSYQRALALAPDMAAAHFDLGCALLNQGKAESAVACYEKALALKPDYFDAYLNLANTYMNLHKAAAAVACCQKALALKPNSAAAYLTQGLAYFELNDFDAGVTSCRRGLACKPDCNQFIMTNYLNNIGAAYSKQGRLEEARAYFQQVLALKPDFVDAFGSMLFTMLPRPAFSAAELYQAHIDFARRIESLVKSPPPDYSNTPQPDRRLKVGYVSPDFNRHSVALFMEPILAHHDKSRVEVYAYYNGVKHDEVTTRLMSYVDHWVPCRNWADGRLAECIRADGIDLLVDLAGYTVGHRLLTFAHKPAPVQLTYLGYMATTGLSAMDYRLSSFELDPPGQEAWHSESLYRLPLGLWCFRPAADRADVVDAPPLLKNGFITFGSTNNPVKISQETLTVWSEILRALPDARLLMTNLPGADLQRSLLERFAAQDVETHRLSFQNKVPDAEFQNLLSQIDIALDPFPYNGTTTTCEALWMGIPVVSLIGETSVARSGYALLKAVGLEELVARDTAEYIKIAVDLARDPARLGSLRTGLRGRMEASALRDEVGFTHALETAYREMWAKWCEARTGRYT